MAITTVARWKMQEDVRVTVLKAVGYGLLDHDFGCYTIGIPNNPDEPFAAVSLQQAEHYASSDPYIICNDDNLIYGQDFVHNGLKIMQDNPEFGCVSGVVAYSPGFDLSKDLTEIHAVGGCVFLRKGLVTEFPPLEDVYWDIERHRQVTAKGFKSGYTRLCPYLHMGDKFSTVKAFFTGA